MHGTNLKLEKDWIKGRIIRKFQTRMALAMLFLIAGRLKEGKFERDILIQIEMEAWQRERRWESGY